MAGKRRGSHEMRARPPSNESIGTDMKFFMNEAPVSSSLIAAGTALMCILGTGCPHDWMKDGTNDRAMRKDLDEELEDLRQASMPCPVGKSRVEDCQADAQGKLTCNWICR
jgi:hypothetical protein